MKIYFKVVALIIFTIGIFGFILPFLFSSKSTELVIIGGCIFIITPVIYYKSLININKNKNQKV